MTTVNKIPFNLDHLEIPRPQCDGFQFINTKGNHGFYKRTHQNGNKYESRRQQTPKRHVRDVAIQNPVKFERLESTSSIPEPFSPPPTTPHTPYKFRDQRFFDNNNDISNLFMRVKHSDRNVNSPKCHDQKGQYDEPPNVNFSLRKSVSEPMIAIPEPDYVLSENNYPLVDNCFPMSRRKSRPTSLCIHPTYNCDKARVTRSRET